MKAPIKTLPLLLLSPLLGQVSSAIADYFTNVQAMHVERAGHTATRLPDGTVLVAGGRDSNFAITRSAELFNPADGSWTWTGPMSVFRVAHAAVLLPNGTV